jgi:hypothetical protein
VEIDYKLFLLQDLISCDSFINQSASLSGPIDPIYPGRLKKITDLKTVTVPRLNISDRGTEFFVFFFEVRN